MTKFTALEYLLTVPGRLYPEERRELQFLLGRVARLEQVEIDANNLLDAVVGEVISQGDLPPVLDPALADDDVWPGAGL